MATAATVPMLSPDGTSGDVPQAQVQAALSKGFKQAVEMTSPDGKLGYIPVERVKDALTAGFNVDTSHPAGIAAAPQLAAHSQAPAMQSSLLAPSTYGKAISDTASGLVSPLAHIPSQIGSYNLVEATNNAGKSGPIQEIINNPDKGAGIANALTQVGTALALGKATEGAAPIVRAGIEKGSNFVNGAGQNGGVVSPSLANRLQLDRIPLVNKTGVGENPSALTPSEQNAVEITKAVNPAQPAWNNYLQSVHDQIGNVIDYAERKGMPIGNARDLAKAAQGAQQETLSHYRDNFLNPNADITVPVPDTYQGPFTGRGRASLEDINNRIDAINRELSANVRKPTTGQASSAGASDVELETEKRGLTSALHQTLADATGVSPQDIAALRVRGGQLKTIASETQGAANTLSGGAAKVDSGAPSLPTSKSGILNEGIALVRGGPERIAAGKLMDALNSSPIQPTPLVKPQITPVAPTVTSPAAAQAEFLRSQQLEQAAQDASTQRNLQANSTRTLNRQVEKAVSTGKGGPEMWASVGKDNIAAHLQQSANAGVSMNDLAHLGETPAGKQFLMRASGMKPGSGMMKNLVQQIAAALSK